MPYPPLDGGAQLINNTTKGLIENGVDLYVGETTRGYGRTREHLEDTKKVGLKKIHIILTLTYMTLSDLIIIE